MSSSLFSLSGHVAFVTGAGSGIGQAIAIGLAQAGSDVALFDMSEPGLKETQSKLSALGRLSTIHTGNVCSKADLDSAISLAESQLGAITCAVNCAGVVDAAPAESMSLAQWRRVLDVDLDGVFLTCQALGNVMLPRKKGSIVNIASISASAAIKGLYQAHYNAAKAAVVQLSKSLAMEWADRGIRCNTISPGFTLTPMNTREDVASVAEQYTKQIPIGRWAKPEDMVGPAVFLCSGASSYVGFGGTMLIWSPDGRGGVENGME